MKKEFSRNFKISLRINGKFLSFFCENILNKWVDVFKIDVLFGATKHLHSSIHFSGYILKFSFMNISD